MKYKFLWNMSAFFWKHPRFISGSELEHRGWTKLFTFESFSVENVYVLELKSLLKGFHFCGNTGKTYASSDFHSQKPNTVFSDRQLYIFLFVSFSSLLLLTPFPLTCLTLRENRYEDWALLQALCLSRCLGPAAHPSWIALCTDGSHKNASFAVEAVWEVIFRPEVYTSTFSAAAWPLLSGKVLWAGRAPMILI